MAIIIDGTSAAGSVSLGTNGTITNLAAGGLPDNTVDGGNLAMGSDAAGDVLYYNGTDYIRLAKGTDGQVLTLASGVPTWAAVASVDNTPSWAAKRTSAWGIASGDWYLVPFNGTDWDTDSAFTNVSGASDNADAKFTVPSGEAGKYAVHYGIGVTGEIDNEEVLALRVWKNGSHYAPSYVRDYSPVGSAALAVRGSILMDLAVGDYIQLYVYHNEGGGVLHNVGTAHLSGYKLIGV